MPFISRRSFCRTAAAATVALHAMPLRAAGKYAIQNRAAEWSYSSGKPYKDPFNEIELDVVFQDAQGQEQRVPAFWAGENNWSVRFAPPAPGRYKYRTVCSDTSNSDLNGRTGELETSTYASDNPLYRHGAVRVAQDRR